MPLADTVASLVGANIGKTIADIVGIFKLSPEQSAQHAEELLKIQNDAAKNVTAALQAEMDSAAEIIKTEAQSQSWLPRNVRPLLLLLWGGSIAANLYIPILARFWVPNLQPIVVDPWVYKLTAIGFTGYVTARTWEKVTNSDS